MYPNVDLWFLRVRSAQGPTANPPHYVPRKEESLYAKSSAAGASDV
jgi:hypothetical protein